MKIIKIIKSKEDFFWYANSIGKEFIAIDSKYGDYIVIGKDEISSCKPENIVFHKDCEVLGELKGFGDPVKYDKSPELHSVLYSGSQCKMEILVSIEDLLHYGGYLYEGRDIYSMDSTKNHKWTIGKYLNWDPNQNCPSVKSDRGISPCSILDKVKIKVNPIWK